MRPAKIHIRPGSCPEFHVSVHVHASKYSSDLDKNRLVDSLNIGTKTRADFAICCMDIANETFYLSVSKWKKKT